MADRPGTIHALAEATECLQLRRLRLGRRSAPGAVQLLGARCCSERTICRLAGNAGGARAAKKLNAPSSDQSRRSYRLQELLDRQPRHVAILSGLLRPEGGIK